MCAAAEAETENHLKPALERHEFCTSACRCRCLRVSHDLPGSQCGLVVEPACIPCVMPRRVGVKRGSARRSSLKGRERTIVIRRTLEPFQRQPWGNFWKTGWSAYGLFRANRYHLELKWTELKDHKVLKSLTTEGLYRSFVVVKTYWCCWRGWLQSLRSLQSLDWDALNWDGQLRGSRR